MHSENQLHVASHRGVWAEDLVDDVRDPLQTLGIQTLRNGITGDALALLTHLKDLPRNYLVSQMQPGHEHLSNRAANACMQTS